jgi:alpha-tubulin suppressor-like RCC1 family protein
MKISRSPLEQGLPRTTLRLGLGIVLGFATLTGAMASGATPTVVAWGQNWYGQTNVPPAASNAVAISAGANHSLALTPEGTVVAWGRNNKGQTAVPVDLSGVVAVAASGGHSLALKDDGRVVAWGSNSAGQTDVPATLSNVVALATRGDHCLALKLDGSVTAWGLAYEGQTEALASLTPHGGAIALAAGSDHALALRADGTVMVWGANGYGQRDIPAAAIQVVAIAAGGDHCLALKADGTLVAWGRNDAGQTTVPAGLSNVATIAARGSCSLAVKEDGTVVAWGNYPTLPVGLTNGLAVSVGDAHAVALVGGREPFLVERPLGGTVFVGRTAYLHVWATGQQPITYQWQCQGTNLPGATKHVLTLNGQEGGELGRFRVVISNALGTVTTGEVLVTAEEGPPVLWTPPAEVVHYLGGTTGFRVEAGGSRPLHYQWRFNGADIPGASEPGLLLPDLTFEAAGWYSVVVSNSFGAVTSAPARLTVITVAAWGEGDKGQVELLPSLTNAVAVAAGSQHSVALKADGTVVAWGRNDYGQCNVPEGLSDVVAVAAGNSHCLALRGDGTVVAWGAGQNNTGIGPEFGQSIVPVGLSDVVAIAARSHRSFAVGADGTVVGWGWLYDGQAEALASLSDVVAIAPGGNHCLALRADGTVVVWGSNWAGQTNVPPELTPPLGGVVVIAAGGSHCLALRADGTVVAWGDNSDGQCDVPLGLTSPLGGAVAIAARSSVSLAVTAEGRVVAWGNDEFDQLVPPADLKTVVGVSVGDQHCLAVVGSGPPFITRAPISRAAYSGTTVEFSALAQGASPLSYQWQYNGVDLAGATHPVLTLTDLQAGQGGDYSVVVRNALGVVTSAPAQLTVIEGPPVIISQPVSRWPYPGGTVSLQVVAEGSWPLFYQWRSNGADLPGATSGVLVINGFTTDQVGSYSVVVSNAFGFILSSPAALGMGLAEALNAPALAWSTSGDAPWFAQPWTTQDGEAAAQSGDVPDEHSSTLETSVTGPGLLSFWWKLSSDRDCDCLMFNIGGEVRAGLCGMVDWERRCLFIPAGTQSLRWVYSRDDDCSQGWPHAAWLDRVSFPATDVPPILVTHPTSQVAPVGGTVTLSAVVEGSPPLGYQWRFNGVDMVGATSSSLLLTNLQYSQTGDYSLVASNAFGVVTSWVASVAVKQIIEWGHYDQSCPADLTNAVALAAGKSYTLALKTDGTVTAWSYYDNGAPYVPMTVPSGLRNVVAIATGSDRSLALKKDGTIVAWSNTGLVYSNLPPGLTNLVAIAASHDRVLALKGDGTMVDWGGTMTTLPPVVTDVIAIAAGWDHSLALKADRTVVAWGYNDYGQTNVPPGLNEVVAIAAGGYHSLALKSDGTVVAWGNNEYGQAAVPAGLNDAVAIAAGGYHSLALKSDGTVVAWGANYLGQIEVPAGLTQPLGGVVSVAAGYYHSLALIGPLAPFLTLQPSPTANQAIFPGQSGSFRVAATGSLPLLYQWRRNGVDIPGATNAVLRFDSATLDDEGDYSVVVSNPFGTVTSASAHLQVAGTPPIVAWGACGTVLFKPPAELTNAVAIAGAARSLALKADGTVVAWPADVYSVPPPDLSNVVAVAADSDSGRNFALRNDGRVVCWYHDWDSLGNPIRVDLVLPGLSNVVGIELPWTRRVLRADGTVAAWRSGWVDALPGLSNVVAIHAGRALRSDGTVVPLDWNQFEDLSSLSNVVALDSTQALKSDGTVMGFDGQQIGALSNIVAIDSSLALQSDGTVVSCGSASGWDVPLGLSNVVAIAADYCRNVALLGYGPPFLTSRPMNLTCASGRPLLLRAQATGALPLSFQWQRDGANLPEATNRVLSLTDLRPEDGGRYSVVVSNAFGSVSNSYGVTVVPAPLTIYLQPASLMVELRGQAVFAVGADGAPPLSYQWQFEGVPIPGATNRLLTLDDVTYNEIGHYSVRVSNPSGTMISSNALLTVNPIVEAGLYEPCPFIPTRIVAIAAGSSYSLALKIDGTVVAWGREDYGLTNLCKVPPDLRQVVAIAAGQYHSLALKSDGTVVAWGYGSQTNVPAGLNDVVAIAAGGNHSLALKADGTIVAWGWNVHGQTNVPPDLTQVVAIAGGYWHSLALKSDGTVVAWGCYDDCDRFLKATVPPGLSNVIAIAAGDNSSMALQQDGTVVAWGYQACGPSRVPPDLTNIVAVAPGSSWDSLALKTDGTALLWNSSGSYFWRSNVTAVAARGNHFLALLGDGSPVLTVQPFSQATVLGQTANLTAMAAGSPPLSYQWQVDGANLRGATNATLELTGVQVSQAGNYTVVVSNTLGTVTSRIAQLTVLVPPSLEPLPETTSAAVGADVTLAVDASGTPPLRYQWRKNGVNIPGATNATLTITNVQVSDGGSYSVVVANIAGAVTSDPTLLIVEVPVVPPGDDFANRVQLTGTTNSVSGTDRWATREPGEPYHAGKHGSNSVWYTWRAPSAGIATFRTVGSTFDTLLGIYTNDLSPNAQSSTLNLQRSTSNVQLESVLNLVAVAQDEDQGGYFTSALRFNAEKQTDYQIAVDGFAGQQGRFILSWELEPTDQLLPVLLTQPESLVVGWGSAVTFNVVAEGEGLSYRWSFNGEEVAGENNSTLTLTNVGLTEVGFYTVRVTNGEGRWVESLAAGLEIGSAPGPVSQDKLEDWFTPANGGAGLGRPGSQRLTSGGGFISVAAGTINYRLLSNTNGTTQAGEPNHCGTIGQASRWLVLVPQSGGTLLVDTVGSGVRTALAVYRSGSLAGLATNVVACDVGGGLDGWSSRVRFEAEAEAAYLVVADSADGQEGLVELNWCLGAAPVVTVVQTNVVVKGGEGLTLSVGVSGAVPEARCQWYLNNNPIAGATNRTLVLTNMQTGAAGWYEVVVSNPIEEVRRGVAWIDLEPEVVSMAGSGFEDGDEGWSVWSGWGRLIHQAGLGRQGSYLWVSSPQSGELRWVAPGKYLGNRGVAYGGWLQFAWRQWGGVWTNPPTVWLSGGGLTLWYRCVEPVGTNWTQYRVRLRGEAGWQRSDGLPALAEELRQVLSELESVEIRSQVSGPAESCALDNVELMAPCMEEAPPLQIRRVPGQAAIELAWPQEALCFELEATDTLRQPHWSTSGLTILQVREVGGLHCVTVALDSASRFFRLRKGLAAAPCASEPPRLQVSREAGQAVLLLEWPEASSCFQLEATDTLGAPRWTTNFTVLDSKTTDSLIRVRVGLTGTSRFFRLKKP